VSTNEDESVSFAPLESFGDAIARRFEEVAAQLRELLPGADIQHVGSTAIPGTLTKGDLDVQVRVPATEYSRAKRELAKIFLLNVGGFASDDAISFEDDSVRPSLGIHLTVIDGSGDIQWKFRDLLTASSDLRADYDRLKRQFDGGSMAQYREAKAEFIFQVMQSRQDSRG
jgi:GrpB-like predicted nucleotidyltransferase (UPF0157 family)